MIATIEIWYDPVDWDDSSHTVVADDAALLRDFYMVGSWGVGGERGGPEGEEEGVGVHEGGVPHC
jgi:hypothetical protein